MPFDRKNVLLTEKNGSYGKEIYYVNPSDQKDVLSVVSSEGTLKENIQYTLKNVFKEIFLPQGYPSSVSEDYTSYQIWDTAQAFCSTITGILATQSVMQGVGVGDTEATPLAATITWVLKDGTGHIGRIAFAWWKGTSLDADSKTWRLVADGLNDAAICLELALPFFKGYTTQVLCLSTAMKAIVGVAGGATRAALTQHQAIRGNLGDVAAKDGSQETAVNLVASLVAILIISLVRENVWPLFFAFTILHLVSNYFAVKSVCLKSFNRRRFLHVINGYLENEKVLPPKYVNQEEPLFSPLRMPEKKLFGYDIYVGYSIKKIISDKSVGLKDFQMVLDVFDNSKYCILIDQRKSKLYVVLHESISSEILLRAYFHSVIFCIILNISQNNFDDKSRLNKTFLDLFSKVKDDFTCEKIQYSSIKEVNDYISIEWKKMSKCLLEKGWNLESELLLAQEWRANWKSIQNKNK